jgi:heat-inducible transcriptional repressor
VVLTERRAAILRLIIGDYVQTAQPIGSEALVQRHKIELSSATIRNEMARLEEEGYIHHPHTSAGRVPSDKGYRYFVETMIGEPDLPSDEKLRILHQFHQATSEMAEWLHLAASVLSQSVRNLAVVTAPHAGQTTVKHLELVALHEHTALLVLVTDAVKVRQQVITFPQPVAQPELSHLANRLSEAWSGLSSQEVAAHVTGSPALEGSVAAVVAEILAEEDATAFAEARVEGLRNVLSQPEFSRSEKLLDLMEAVDERNLPKAIPAESVAEDGVTVIIGAENPNDSMRECSIVITNYGTPEGHRGAIAVLGPTRMHYPRAIATVRYMGRVMSDVLTRLYS